MINNPQNVFNSRRHYRLERMRFGQQEAALTIEKCVFASKEFIAIVLPTRYGKSDVIRATAGQLVETGHACCALVLSPNTTLRGQMIDQLKLKEMIDRLEPTFDINAYTMDKIVDDPGCNGEWLISANIHLVQRNVDLIGEQIARKVRRTGKTVLVYIDEAHTGSKTNEWGNVARVLARAGATIILLTATPYRADGEEIFGFQTVTVEEEDYTKIVPSEGSTPDLVKLTTYEGSRRVVKLKADYEYTLKAAWDEDPLPIAKLEWLPFEVNVEEFTEGKENKARLLSELKPTVVQRILGRVVRDPRVIENGVRTLVVKLRELKKKDPKVCAIVFCGNDIRIEEESEFDAHARLVRDYLKLIGPELSVVISTSSSDEDNDDPLKAFCAGTGDVLLVKQRASLGLDVGPLKVALDLSPVRTLAAFQQRMMRIATIYKGMFGIYICPNEVIASGHFEEIVTRNGGEMTIADLEEVSSVEVDRKDQKDKKAYTVTGTGSADFGDSEQNWADKGMMIKVEAFRQMFPEIIGGPLSHAVIAARIEECHMDLVIPKRADTEAFDSKLRIFTLRRSITTTMREAIKRSLRAQGITEWSNEQYSEMSKALWRPVHKAAGSTFVPLERQNNIAILQVMEKRATEILTIIMQGGGD